MNKSSLLRKNEIISSISKLTKTKRIIPVGEGFIATGKMNEKIGLAAINNLTHSENFNMDISYDYDPLEDIEPVAELIIQPFPDVFLQLNGENGTSVAVSGHQNSNEDYIDIFIWRTRKNELGNFMEWMLHDHSVITIVGDDIMFNSAHDGNTDSEDWDISRAFVGSYISFLTALNCHNVSTIDVPAPKKINKKRAKKGNCLFSSYKQLVIESKGSREVIRSGVNEREYSSRRMHVRRGHIRRLSTGKHVWVRHSIVGANAEGVVEKDYKVKF